MNRLRQIAILRLSVYATAMAVGFSLLTVGVVYGVRLLDHPGCMLLADSEFSHQTLLDLFTRRSLTESGVSSHDGATSPDGRYGIAARPARSRSGGYIIYVYSIQTGDEVVLQRDVRLPSAAADWRDYTRWSPDNRQVAYLWQSTDRQVYLSIASADGSQKLSASVNNVSGEPARWRANRLLGWSADGRLLALSGDLTPGVGSAFSFWSTADLSRAASPLPDGAFYRVAWSSQGHQFAAVTVARPDAPSQLALFSPGQDTPAVTVPLPRQRVSAILWSPSGRYVTLASMASDCAGSGSCLRRWNFDIYGSDGEALFTGLRGGQLAYRTITNSAPFPDSAPLLSASWSGDSWVYMRDGEVGSRPITDWVALDAATGAFRVIASGVVNQLAREMFYVSPGQRVDLTAPENVALIPDGGRIVLPTWQADGAIKVELADMDGQNRSTLVENVSEIVDSRVWPDSIWPLFWGWQGEWVIVPWARDAGGARRVGVTAARRDGSSLHTLDDGLAAMSDLRLVDLAPDVWLGYTARRDGQLGVELFDLQTGERRVLLAGLAEGENWTLAPALHEQKVAVMVQPPGTSYPSSFSRLYLVPPDGQGPVELNPQIVNFPAWSPDSALLAFVKRAAPRRLALEIVADDGSRVQEIPLRARVDEYQWILDWNDCLAGA